MSTDHHASELGSWDATETAARIRSGEVSAREVLDAAIARAQSASVLNAVVTDTFERARTARPKNGGALSGVPTFVKDLAQLEGVRTTWGSAASGHYVSRKSESFVRRFEETGIAILGKSATPELGLMATTEPIGRAPTRNPWDPTRSTGGSSGGAGALVAAGVVPIAHASDGGGSIRIPAACCGLVGFKPSRSRMDMEGSNLLPINIATDGVVTRTVRDQVLFYEALESRRPPKKVPPIAHRNGQAKRHLRIGMFHDSPVGTSVHADVRAATEAAGRVCESLGHRVEAIASPFDASVIDDFLAFWGFVAWIQKSTARVMLHSGFDTSRFEPWTNGMAATFTKRPLAAASAMRRLRGFTETYARIMTSYDVLLSPICAEPAPSLGYLATDQPFEQLFDRLRSYCPFTPIHNAAGAPAIALPLARSAAGLPIGVQFAGAMGDDGRLLDLAASIEQSNPWPLIAPRTNWSSASA